MFMIRIMMLQKHLIKIEINININKRKKLFMEAYVVK